MHASSQCCWEDFYHPVEYLSYRLKAHESYQLVSSVRFLLQTPHLYFLSTILAQSLYLHQLEGYLHFQGCKSPLYLWLLATWVSHSPCYLQFLFDQTLWALHFSVFHFSFCVYPYLCLITMVYRDWLCFWSLKLQNHAVRSKIHDSYSMILHSQILYIKNLNLWSISAVWSSFLKLPDCLALTKQIMVWIF